MNCLNAEVTFNANFDNMHYKTFMILLVHIAVLFLRTGSSHMALHLFFDCLV